MCDYVCIHTYVLCVDMSPRNTSQLDGEALLEDILKLGALECERKHTSTVNKGEAQCCIQTSLLDFL